MRMTILCKHDMNMFGTDSQLKRVAAATNGQQVTECWRVLYIQHVPWTRYPVEHRCEETKRDGRSVSPPETRGSNIPVKTKNRKWLVGGDRVSGRHVCRGRVPRTKTLLSTVCNPGLHKTRGIE